MHNGNPTATSHYAKSIENSVALKKFKSSDSFGPGLSRGPWYARWVRQVYNSPQWKAQPSGHPLNGSDRTTKRCSSLFQGDRFSGHLN
jgi:hypothetical protein